MTTITRAEWERAGRSTARERMLRTLGRLPPGEGRLASWIGEKAKVPMRSLGVELVNLKRAGALKSESVPPRWWRLGLCGHRAKLWRLSDEGRRIVRLIGR